MIRSSISNGLSGIPSFAARSKSAELRHIAQTAGVYLIRLGLKTNLPTLIVFEIIKVNTDRSRKEQDGVRPASVSDFQNLRSRCLRR